MIKRPLLSQVLPDRLKQSLYYRYYQTRHAGWAGLFEDAPLAYSPGVRMHGLLPGDVVSGNIAFNGFYELSLTRRIAALARRGGTFVDVGANMGYFSLLWAGSSASGKVVAFEASPRNIGILENNVARNGLASRITVVPKAAGRHSGVVAFDVGSVEQSGWGGISPTDSPNSIEVPIVRLDQELPDGPIDVLKIDVEGADTWVLFGCEGLLRNRRIGHIFFEENRSRMERLGIQPGEAQAFLRGLNYACVPYGSDGGDWMAYPNGGPAGTV